MLMYLVLLNTSFDPLSHITYNAAITANYIYRVHTETTKPRANLAGFTFTNVSPDPVRYAIGNVSWIRYF